MHPDTSRPLPADSTPVDVVARLAEVEAGADGAFEQLLAAVYPTLRDMAHALLRGQHNGRALSTTSLVHEAYLRLVRYQEVDWKGRAHFFGAAARTMRRVLVDHARRQSAEKRRGEHVTLTTVRGDTQNVSLAELLDLDGALDRLAEERPRWVRVVECRYFAGLTLAETAAALGLAESTVSNDWRLARAWLLRELDA